MFQNYIWEAPPRPKFESFKIPLLKLYCCCTVHVTLSLVTDLVDTPLSGFLALPSSNFLDIRSSRTYKAAITLGFDNMHKFMWYLHSSWHRSYSAIFARQLLQHVADCKNKSERSKQQIKKNGPPFGSVSEGEWSVLFRAQLVRSLSHKEPFVSPSWHLVSWIICDCCYHGLNDYVLFI